VVVVVVAWRVSLLMPMRGVVLLTAGGDMEGYNLGATLVHEGKAVLGNVFSTSLLPRLTIDHIAIL
jgi:hypothetical protein